MSASSEAQRIARGVLYRIGKAYRQATTDAIREVRGAVEPRVRSWVANRYPTLARAYEGAASGRRRENWTAGSSSANVEIERDIVKLRNRARDLARNDPIAARILDALVIHVVGSGIVPKCNTGSEGLDAFVDKLFGDWAKRSSVDGVLGFYGQQALAARTLFESGEVLAIEMPRRASLGLPVPLQIDLLEPDYLDHTLTGTSSLAGKIPAGHYLHQGVEFDADGRRVAYYLYKQHPGETSSLGGATIQRVRKSAEECAHVYKPTRAGQVRGVTTLASVMWTLRQMNLYLDAELERKGTEAMVVGVATNADPLRAGIGDVSTETSADGTVRHIGDMESGTFLNIGSATDIKFNNPQPTDAASATKGYLRRAASGVGMPYELLSSDLEGVNYSSIRYGTLPFRQSVWTWQEQVFIPLFCDRVWQWFIAAAIASGRLADRPGGYPVKWATPRWEEVDRLKEAMADVMEIRSGLRSYPDVLASRGESWREVMAEAQQWIAAMEKAGVSFDCDPRRPQTAAASTVDPAADPAPPEPATDPAAAPAPEPAAPDVGRMLDVVQELTEGSIGADTARALIEVGFPHVDSEQVARLVESVKR